MLRTDLLALAAFYTVRCFSKALSIPFIITSGPINRMKTFEHVESAEYPGNGDVLWTTLHAVLAGGALDGGHGVDEGARLFYCFQLIIVHGLEISERAQVFLHLIRTRHTGQNSNDPVQ